MKMLPSANRSGLGIPALGYSLFVPQNGVAAADGAMSMDTRNGNVGSHSHGSLHHRQQQQQQQRPTALQMRTEHLSKNLRTTDYDDDEDDNSDRGSLPCTPHSELQMSGYTAEEDEVLESDTRQLLADFFKLIAGISQPRRNQRAALTTMKRVVENLIEKHRYAYNGMINKLSVDDRGDDVTFISSVATSLFEDGTTNWGRIASLISFGAVVCQYLKTKGRESCVEKVAVEMSSYLLRDQRDWLIRNNAWEGFVEFFRVDDPESKMRNTLMAVAGLAGIGATLAMLISDGPDSVVRNTLLAIAGVAGVGATVARLIR